MPLSVETFHKLQRAEGPAAVLAIGTAAPPNIYYQDSYADFYFRVTNSEHQVWLKNKFKHICEKSEIKKRHMFLTEEMLKENPSIGSYDEPSLDARRKLLVDVVPALGAEAAAKALMEWNRPKSSITHLIFCTTGAINMPGGDLQVAKLLGLNPFVNRTMLYLQGCSAGGTALRLAKDMAENNKGARVLVVCSEVCMIFFRGPCETNISSLVGPALFGDGAGSIIVGSDPITDLEKPLFQLVSANQGFIPKTDTTLEGHLLEIGLTFHLERELPDIIANNLKSNLLRAFKPLKDIEDWNSLFWVLHPGGPLVMKKIETQLNLDSEKLKDTRKILQEYGNMSSASVIFILDELQKRSRIEGLRTTGGGLELGVLIGLGPGLTVETIVLRSIPL